MFGHEGLAILDEEYLLLNSSSPNFNKVRLDSSSGYGGDEEVNTTHPGIGTPHIYDYREFTVSLDISVDYKTLNLLLNWMVTRETTKKLILYFNRDSTAVYGTAYLSSFSLSASDGDNVSGSIDLLVVDDPTRSQKEDYITNRTGLFGGGLPIGDFTTGIGPLNPDGKNHSPYPYWNTRLIGFPPELEVISWNFNFNNNISKGFAAEGNAFVQSPKWVFLGPADATLDVTLIPSPGSGFQYVTDVNTLEYDIPSIGVIIGTAPTQKIITATTELQTDGQSVGGMGDLTSFDVTYQIYKLTAA